MLSPERRNQAGSSSRSTTRLARKDKVNILNKVIEGIPDRFTSLSQSALKQAFSLPNGERLDVNLLGKELIGSPPHVLVSVSSPLQDVGQSQPRRSDAPDNCPPHHIVWIMRQVEEVGLDDGTLFVLGVLQPLQRRDSLAPNLSLIHI